MKIIHMDHLSKTDGWYIEWQQVATSGRMSADERQRVITTGAMNGDHWQRMTTNDNEQ